MFALLGEEMPISGAFRQVGAAIVAYRRLRGAIAPANQAAFVDWVQRVDEQQRAADGHAGSHSALAEPVHQRGFRLAAQARFGEPRVQCLDVILGNHGDASEEAVGAFPARSRRSVDRIYP